jgi:hypothetical protein
VSSSAARTFTTMAGLTGSNRTPPRASAHADQLARQQRRDDRRSAATSSAPLWP